MIFVSFIFLKYAFAISFFAVLALILFFKERRRNRRTELIFATIINNFKIKILAMQLDKNTFASTILTLVDHETQEPISDVIFSDTVLTSSDEDVFTVLDVDADGTADVLGVTEGTATLNVKTKASYVNSLGDSVTTDEEADVEVTVTAPLPGANETDLIITFGPPQPTV